VGYRLRAIMFALILAGCATSPGQTGTVDTQFESVEAKIMAHEYLIADCMRAEGFDYIAHLPSDWLIEEATQQDILDGGDGTIDVESLDLPEDPNADVRASRRHLTQPSGVTLMEAVRLGAINRHTRRLGASLWRRRTSTSFSKCLCGLHPMSGLSEPVRRMSNA